MHHVSHTQFNGADQLGAKKKFTITRDHEPPTKLARQRLSYVSIASLHKLKDFAKINLEKVIVHTESEVTKDKNNSSYRVFRAVDESGKAVWVKVWGTYADEPEIFAKGTTVSIQQAVLSRAEQRINIREGSRVVKHLTSARMPVKVSFIGI